MASYIREFFFLISCWPVSSKQVVDLKCFIAWKVLQTESTFHFLFVFFLIISLGLILFGHNEHINRTHPRMLFRETQSIH